jgi:hypothetical protein
MPRDQKPGEENERHTEYRPVAASGRAGKTQLREPRTLATNHEDARGELDPLKEESGAGKTPPGGAAVTIQEVIEPRDIPCERALQKRKHRHEPKAQRPAAPELTHRPHGSASGYKDNCEQLV